MGLGRTGEVADTIRLPFFQLVAHTMELSLKAALSFQGRDEEDLIGIGHELEWCRRRATRGGMNALEDSKVASLIDCLGPPHARQAFRYPQHFHWPLPDVEAALHTLAGLLDAVDSYILTSER